jgi:dephospho-CoA kinase
MKIIGMTGGIASGKSTVTRMLAERGAIVYSADEDARAVVAPGTPGLAAVLEAFPEVRAADGSLDRAALGARIFADPEARARLDALTHPAIVARMRKVIAEARAGGEPGVLVYEVPLLYEAGRESLFDAIIAVLATPAHQAERLQTREAAKGRPPLSEEAIAERLASQLSPEEKARRANYVIRTDVPLEETEAQVEKLWEQLRTSSVSGP